MEGGACGGVAGEAEHFGGEGVGSEGVLDEFLHDFAFGEDVDHAEVFDADDGFADEVGEPVDVVDEGVGEAQAGGFEGCGAGGDGAGGGVLHEVVGCARFDPGGGFGEIGGLRHVGHFGGEGGVSGGDGEAGFGVLFADDFRGLEHDGEEAADLVFAAAGEPADEVGFAGVGAAELGGAIDHGVTTELGGEAAGFVEGFFEREDANHQVEDAGHDLDAAFFPGPDLGADVVDEFAGVTAFAEGFGDAEVEAGVVDEDDCSGSGGEDLGDGFVEALLEVAVHFEDLPEADDAGGLYPIGDVFATDGFHFGSAEAAELGVGVEVAQGLHEA